MFDKYAYVAKFYFQIVFIIPDWERIITQSGLPVIEILSGPPHYRKNPRHISYRLRLPEILNWVPYRTSKLHCRHQHSSHTTYHSNSGTGTCPDSSGEARLWFGKFLRETGSVSSLFAGTTFDSSNSRSRASIVWSEKTGFRFS